MARHHGKCCINYFKYVRGALQSYHRRPVLPRTGSAACRRADTQQAPALVMVRARHRCRPPSTLTIDTHHRHPTSAPTIDTHHRHPPSTPTIDTPPPSPTVRSHQPQPRNTLPHEARYSPFGRSTPPHPNPAQPSGHDGLRAIFFH
ncbi:hypothetical protein RJ55_02923 [Drechmeria coniospora]|nr:hypothetical protein RJ55_02923 [Drechmeria coniospora]